MSHVYFNKDLKIPDQMVIGDLTYEVTLKKLREFQIP